MTRTEFDREMDLSYALLVRQQGVFLAHLLAKLQQLAEESHPVLSSEAETLARIARNAPAMIGDFSRLSAALEGRHLHAPDRNPDTCCAG